MTMWEAVLGGFTVGIVVWVAGSWLERLLKGLTPRESAVVPVPPIPAPLELCQLRPLTVGAGWVLAHGTVGYPDSNGNLLVAPATFLFSPNGKHAFRAARPHSGWGRICSVTNQLN